ncbi:MAG: CAP domain-containing protein [Actinobacteria bacterium]|nr:CAP domain-containing protein [Actinomycetota bacterium]
MQYMLSPSTTVRRLRLGLAVVAAAAALTSTACEPAKVTITHQQWVVKDEMNRDRRGAGLWNLPSHYDATKKAQAWAEKLARDGRLSHSNLPDGINSRWCALGENVGYGSSVAAIEDAYMRSSGHRANILSRRWNAVGTGFAKKDGRVYTVQVFIQTC